MPISLTHFHAKGVAKKYEIVGGVAVKKSAETFKSGPYKTTSVASMGEFAVFLKTLQPGDFITAGVNQNHPSGMCGLGEKDVHRTKETFPFASEKPGVLIIDGDNLEELKLHNIDRFAIALEQLIGNADYVLSPSASSFISKPGECGKLHGMHAFVFVDDASQIPETLEALHKRSVLMGYGYPLITKAGVTLIRSLVDTAMKTANQPCFEGGAILAEGLTQERKILCSKLGETPNFLDIEPLSQEEETEFEIKKNELIDSVAEEAATVRTAWLEEHGKKLADKGCPPKKVRAILDAALSGERPVLSGDFEIQTDRYGIKTVRQLLADPEVYNEATCGDPLDPDDGAGKAKIYCLNQEGRPAINSFAHGGNVYILEDIFREFTDEDNESLELATTTENILEVVDRTDSGNVAILYKITTGDLRYVPGLKCFMAWHNKQWEMDPNRVHAHEMALAVANDYSKQANKVSADSMQPHLSEKESDRMQKIADSIKNWASQCRNKHRLDAMLGLAQRDRRFVVEDSNLDQNLHLLGVQNGVVNLKTGELRADSRSDFVTKRCSVVYNQMAEASRWSLFISEITSCDGRLVDEVLQRTERPHLATFLQKLLGYCLTGLTVEQLLIIMWGLGSNGKNVLLDTVVKALGDYAETVSPEILMATKFDNGADSATPSVRKLAGARLAISSEPKEGQKLEAAIVKRHTGGGYITARGLHQSPITFPITHKLILMTNNPPPVDHMDAAMQGRINMIPFDMRWNRPGEIDPDPNLPNAQKDLMEVLDAELEGILLWLVQGAVAYFAEGLQAPAEVRSSTRSYLESQDSLKQWLGSYEKCVPAKGQLAAVLHMSYHSFCREEDMQVKVNSPAGLGKKLKALGYQNKKGRDGMRYGLRKVADIAVEQAKANEEREEILSGWGDGAEDIETYLDRVLGVGCV